VSRARGDEADGKQVAKYVPGTMYRALGEKRRALGVRVVVLTIEERFFDCVSRRFARKQKRGTLRSE